MRHMGILAAVFALSWPLHAQDPDPYSDRINEIDIAFFNAFELNKFSGPGSGYKPMTGSGAWRIGTGIGFSINFHF